MSLVQEWVNNPGSNPDHGVLLGSHDGKPLHFDSVNVVGGAPTLTITAVP